ncbi:MAG: hypothetical protein G01um101433_955 [Parcubacteria group bacterium Gr01-1014_33]|nr:MAG: hypothetical protein G01um101433_955 [Parcubacteria group bacterium Gr01-1014_33]
MGKIIEKVLEALQFRAEITVDLLDAVLSDRGTFYRKTRRFYRQGPQEFKTDWAEWYRKRQSFYSLLNHLKREGLVEKKKKAGNSLWRITKKGVKKLMLYGKKERHPGGIPMKRYSPERVSTLTIVAFDIPETQRKKREWLRENLIAFNLTMLQKSVWVGTVKIPEDFIKDLRRQEMIPYVHIFSVGRRGTIQQVT